MTHPQKILIQSVSGSCRIAAFTYVLILGLFLVNDLDAAYDVAVLENVYTVDT